MLLKIVTQSKVEKILKGSLDLISSPSVKLQIMGGKVCYRCKGKTLLGVVNKFLKPKGEGDGIENLKSFLIYVKFLQYKLPERPKITHRKTLLNGLLIVVLSIFCFTPCNHTK